MACPALCLCASQAELPRGASERWVVLVVGSCSSRISSPFCAASICPSRFYSACATQEMLCLRVAVPLASNFKINCL